MSAAKMTAPPHAFKLPPLPFKTSALEPAISEATLTEHHDFHHKKYIDETNKLVVGSGHENLRLADLVRAVSGKKDSVKLFNNAAQAWNHAFYWQSLSPKTGKPTGELAKRIDADFGSLDELHEKLIAEGTAHFASGWAWLVQQGDKLAVISTHDAGSPLTMDATTPLLVVDVWEHAYYLDRKHDRPAYLKAVVGAHLNWDFAGSILATGKIPDLGVD